MLVQFKLEPMKEPVVARVLAGAVLLATPAYVIKDSEVPILIGRTEALEKALAN